MGCGRSCHRTPSQNGEEGEEDSCEGEREKKGRKDSKKGKGTTNAATNGSTGEVKGTVEKAVSKKCRREGVGEHGGHCEEPRASLPKTEVAVSKSSFPGFARASSGQKPKSPSRPVANFSLLNGGSCADQAFEDEAKTEMQMAESRTQKQVDNANPFHVTTSQLEFFKMLDEKIEQGADYDSDDDDDNE